MKTLRKILILTIVSLVFACQKGEQGEVGPVGAQGSKGATGDKGEVGITNSKGMLVTSWYAVNADAWGALSATSFGAILGLSALTADIANKGNVYFYMQPFGESFVYPLPYSQTNGTKFFGYFVNTNNKQLVQFTYSINPALGGTKLTTGYKFRMVIIPAGARRATEVDMLNYESVKKYLDLTD
ncbi:MAG: collagen-like protein [Cytophagaceae bacterium]|nr:collagen-like protein [Cytophagaceae bacterium]